MIALMMCEKCDNQMEEVFTAQENMKLKGWLCPACLDFMPTIQRHCAENQMSENAQSPGFSHLQDLERQSLYNLIR